MYKFLMQGFKKNIKSHNYRLLIFLDFSSLCIIHVFYLGYKPEGVKTYCLFITVYYYFFSIAVSWNWPETGNSAQ